MLACYAWSNLQILNVTNAVVNIYAGEQADLFIRIGPHISENLIKSIERSGVFEHVYCIDPLKIDVSKERGGKIRWIRAFSLKHAYVFAYDSLLGRLCGEQKYERALLPWFFADSVYFLHYWAKYNDKLAVTFVEEGTSSYYYTKKQMCFPLFNAPTRRAKIKRYLMEGNLMRKFGKRVDTICLYRPEYCAEDIDFAKKALPIISENENPIMHKILLGAAANLDYTHFMRYEKRDIYYFSAYNLENKEFEVQSEQFLQTILDNDRANKIICKVHTHNTTHAEKFARDLEDQIFVDRVRYIFEGMYMQLPDEERKVIVSCVSTAAMNPKFMFGKEPYIIFTYRLYNDYRQHPVECDDLLSGILIESYDDKSKIMIPNSVYELAAMVRRIRSEINGD